MTYSLYPHQAEAEHLLRQGSAVLWWEMRTGKTRAVLHAFSRLVEAGELRDLVVVAGVTFRAVWKEEAEAMGLGLPFVDLRGTTARTRRATPDPSSWGEAPRIYLVNWEILQHWLPWLQEHLQVERFALVGDECHLHLRRPSGATARYKAFDALAQGTDHVWELTGTYKTRSALDLYHQLRPLGPKGDPFFYTKKACYKAGKLACGKCFACRYCNAVFNGYAATGVSYEGTRDEADLMRRLTSVSVLREEDVREVPISDRVPVWVGEGEDDVDLDVDLPDTEISAAQMSLVPTKIELAAAYLAELRAGDLGDEPVVVFGWHRKFTEGLASRLDALVVTGDTSESARNRIRHDFAAGKIPTLVGNLMAMGLGIDLSAARYFLYGEPYYDAAMHLQAEARGRGPKQRAKRLQHHYLLVRRSIDERVWRVRLARGAAIERLYNAGREAGRQRDYRHHEEG